MIKSFSFSESEIINNCLQLYTEGTFDCDLTYGLGNIYKSSPDPVHKFDINPSSPDVIKHDFAQCLGLKLYRSIVFDPPFFATNHIIMKRFGSYPNIECLLQSYSKAIYNISLQLKDRGNLFFKCQDVTNGKRNFILHSWIISECLKHNMICLDIFILLSKNRFTNLSVAQSHSRKFHCYWIVFKKLSPGDIKKVKHLI